VDIRNLAEVEAAITPKTKALYFETPMNPTTMLADVKALAALGKKHRLKTAVDATFAPPPLQNPLEMGIDIVIHSTTKYLNGHGDSLGGVVIGSLEDIQRIRLQTMGIICGAPQHPFTAYLVLRGLKTLHVRMERHSQNALRLARFLETLPQVARVYYPGLESHPQHALAKAQMKGGYSGMLAFEIKDGVHGLSAFDAVQKFFTLMTIPTLAASLADPETLILHPVTGSHRNVPEEARLKAGITDGLVRVSVGLEDAEDLVADFKQALEKI
jgi:methionine-gamma-lyase